MDDKGMRAGEKLNGIWLIAELTSPAAYGMLHVDTFLVKSRPRKTKKEQLCIPLFLRIYSSHQLKVGLQKYGKEIIRVPVKKRLMSLTTYY